MLPVMNPFPPEALESNRQGKLARAQREAFTSVLRLRNRSALGAAGVALMVAVLIVFFGPHSLALVWRIAIVGSALGLAVSLILRTVTGGDAALSRDLRRGRVESLAGPIAKEHEPALDADSTSIYILNVGDQRFTVAPLVFEAAPATGQVRLHYLPASRKVVNLERLSDAPLTPGGTVQRPLEEAIVGSWRNSFANATFTSDGHVTANVRGRRATGRWSVDGAGRLHADIAGQTGMAQASVLGTELRITLGGKGFTLTRQQ
jgi:hypothetical protein